MATKITSLTMEATFGFTQPSANDLYGGNRNKSLGVKQTYSKGSGVAQCDVMATDQYVIPAGQILHIDLLDGAYWMSDHSDVGPLVNLENEQVQFARIKAFLVQLADKAGGSTQVHVNPSTVHAAMTLGGKVKAAGLGVAPLKSGFLAWEDPTAAGEVCSPTSHSMIEIANDDVHPATVNVAIGGCAE
jgi:hypothetical protein